MPSVAPDGPLPGPEDRESFFAAQARHRRRAGWYTVATAVPVALLGVPLSVLFTPFVAAAALVVADLVNLGTDVPDPVRRLDELGAAPSAGTVALLTAATVLPGAVVLLLAWAGVRRLNRGARAGASVIALGARAPRPDDLGEIQAVNVVEELAVAARIRPPGVMVLDSGVPNAAAVGSGIDDCTIVVTTGLLAALDRDETQGVLAHLVASAGNGDLRIGLNVTSLFQVMGLVRTVLGAPADARHRKLWWRVVRSAVRPRDAAESGLLVEELVELGAGNELPRLTGAGVAGWFLRLPFATTAFTFSATAGTGATAVVTPLLRRAWVHRKHLADATAVRLTRNPDGLARGLLKLRGRVAGADWAAHLFAAQDAEPEHDLDAIRFVPLRQFQPSLPDRVDRLRAMGASVPAQGRVPGPPVVVRAFLGVFWIMFGAMVVAFAALYFAFALAVEALYLAPFVAALHLGLRALAGG